MIKLLKKEGIDLSKFNSCETKDFGDRLFLDFSLKIFPEICKDLGYSNFSEFFTFVCNKECCELGNIFVKHCSSLDTFIVFLFFVLPIDVIVDFDFVYYKIYDDLIVSLISSVLS